LKKSETSLDEKLDREQKRQKQLESEMAALKRLWQPTYVLGD
jgi:hypothetical protein